MRHIEKECHMWYKKGKEGLAGGGWVDVELEWLIAP